jgi:hypothetical protein
MDAFEPAVWADFRPRWAIEPDVTKQGIPEGDTQESEALSDVPKPAKSPTSSRR